MTLGRPSRGARMRHRGSRLAGALLAIGLAWVAVAPAVSAAAGELPVTIDLPSSVTVGAQLLGSFSVQNTTEATVTLSGFRITPSCSSLDSAPYCRVHADFDVLSLASALGREGTGCAGTTFVRAPSPIGFEDFQLQPADGSNFVLATASTPGSSSCAVDVAFDVLKVPADSNPSAPGVQTLLYASTFLPGPPDFTTFELTIDKGTDPATVALRTGQTGTVGGPIAATATVAATAVDTAPTGTVAFTLFGPGDETCVDTPLATTPAAAVQVDGTSASEPFTPTVPGTYRWIAAYGGDGGYGPATTACADLAARTVVAKATTTLGLVASPAVAPGGTIFAAATLAGGIAPGGEILFKAWRNNLTCLGPADLASTAMVTDNGRYTSASFAAALVGTYRFTASYGGDATNSVVETTCDAPGTSVVVKAPEVVPPSITLDSGADAARLDPPGGTFKFHLTITNTTGRPVTVKTLHDSVYGDLGGRGSCKAGIPLTASPGPGNTYSCAYEGEFSGSAGATQTSTVRVSVLDALANEATASHDRTVTIAAAVTKATVATPVNSGASTGTSTGTGTRTGTGTGIAGTLARTGGSVADRLGLGLGLVAVGLVLARRRPAPAGDPRPPLTRPW